MCVCVSRVSDVIGRRRAEEGAFGGNAGGRGAGSVRGKMEGPTIISHRSSLPEFSKLDEMRSKARWIEYVRIY